MAAAGEGRAGHGSHTHELTGREGREDRSTADDGGT